MAKLLDSNPAPGAPGDPLSWSRADKDAIGTAYSLSSQVWYTIAGGLLTEIYFPDVDTPQVRDFQLIITDGSTFFHDAQKDFDYQCTWPDAPALSFRLTAQAKGQPYTVVQDVIAESDATTTATAVGIYYVDLVTAASQAGSSRVFTFFWTSTQTWKGVNYAVTLDP